MTRFITITILHLNKYFMYHKYQSAFFSRLLKPVKMLKNAPKLTTLYFENIWNTFYQYLTSNSYRRMTFNVWIQNLTFLIFIILEQLKNTSIFGILRYFFKFFTFCSYFKYLLVLQCFDCKINILCALPLEKRW